MLYEDPAFRDALHTNAMLTQVAFARLASLSKLVKVDHWVCHICERRKIGEPETLAEDKCGYCYDGWGTVEEMWMKKE